MLKKLLDVKSEKPENSSQNNGNLAVLKFIKNSVTYTMYELSFLNKFCPAI